MDFTSGGTTTVSIMSLYISDEINKWSRSTCTYEQVSWGHEAIFNNITFIFQSAEKGHMEVTELLLKASPISRTVVDNRDRKPVDCVPEHSVAVKRLLDQTWIQLLQRPSPKYLYFQTGCVEKYKLDVERRPRHVVKLDFLTSCHCLRKYLFTSKGTWSTLKL